MWFVQLSLGIVGDPTLRCFLVRVMYCFGSCVAFKLGFIVFLDVKAVPRLSLQSYNLNFFKDLVRAWLVLQPCDSILIVLMDTLLFS